MAKIVSDPKNSHHFKITKQDTPIYMVSIDLQDIHRGHINVITEYVPHQFYADMISQHRITSYLHLGKMELGYEDGITPMSTLKKIKLATSNLPTFHVPTFLVRLACMHESGLLAQTIGDIQSIARQIIHTGVQDDPVMSAQDYSMDIKALDHMDLYVSGDVDDLAAKNAMPTLENAYHISDIYAKTKKPLKNLIRRAYFVPPEFYEMHVFNNGVAKLQKMSDREIVKQKAYDDKTYISWGQMQKIRQHQKPLAKLVKRPLHHKK